MKYQVEYRGLSDHTWSLDSEFDSMGEAISYATSQALLTTDYEHRITTQKTVMTIPPLEDYA